VKFKSRCFSGLRGPKDSRTLVHAGFDVENVFFVVLPSWHSLIVKLTKHRSNWHDFRPFWLLRHMFWILLLKLTQHPHWFVPSAPYTIIDPIGRVASIMCWLGTFLRLLHAENLTYTTKWSNWPTDGQFDLLLTFWLIDWFVKFFSLLAAYIAV
jgi:hypothetical protein